MDNKTIETILDDVFKIITDLGAIRELLTEPGDRKIINNNIKSMTELWRKLDNEE